MLEILGPFEKFMEAWFLASFVELLVCQPVSGLVCDSNNLFQVRSQFHFHSKNGYFLLLCR